MYVEVQHGGLESQTAINAGLRRLAVDAGLPLVATCDAHYPCREDADAHEALLAIQTRDLLSNPSRFRFDTKEFFLKTGAEMAASLPDFMDAIPVSVEVAERCSALRLPLGRRQAPALPGPRRRERRGLPGAPLPRGPGRPLPRRPAGRRARSGCASSWA